MLKIKTEIQNPQSKTGNILIVDDMEGNLILLDALLTEFGYSVVSAINGKDALEKLHTQKCYDLIISDILMPVMDGFMLCKSVKKDKRLKNIPFVFYSASFTDEKDEALALKLGVVKFIRKPIEPEEFLKIVQGLMAGVDKDKTKLQEIVLEDDRDTLELYNERLVDKLQTKVFALEHEIKERKHVDEILQFTRFAVDKSSDATFWIGVNGNISYVNHAACQSLGYTYEELVSMTVPDVDPDFHTQSWSTHWQQMKVDGSMSFESRHKSKNGHVFPVEVSASYLKYNDKEHICAYVRNIAERKQAVEVLHKSEEKYSRLIENLQDNYFLYSHDTEGVFTYLSPAITNILGYNAEEFLTHYSEYLTDNPSNSKVARHTDLSIKGFKQPPYELEIYHKDGSVRTLSVQEVPVFDKSHKVISVEGIAEDITKRKKIEKDLKESEATFRSLIDDVLDNSTVGIFILNANFQIIWVNKALEQYFGLCREEIIGKDKRQTIREKLVHILDDQETFVERVFATYSNNTYIESFECHVLPEGQRKERWLLHNSMPIKSGIYVGGRIEHYHDITNRKRAEEKLVTYQAQLKHISSELSLAEERERRRISEDLHDRIGQALTVIKMKLEELKAPQVDTDSDRVLRETEELLSNAIQETRALTFEISPPILYELGFESAVEWLIEQFRERHNILIDYEGNGEGKILDDDVSSFLFKSVRELLFNVIKHARADRIKVSVQREGNSIQISIEDDGIGFDSSKVQFSVNDLSGFGLFSIRERMEYFGGNFDVGSKHGHGTHITLAMPLGQQKGDRGAK
ncbi:MAG: PAS domain S-box protein [Candidatus Scalindua sp.]|nr:PAS domain S-box protein [Candidatus Scalindua sp.]MBT6049021.1 PAS domain S-box protein [Candidatus Scalindua sp.]MBT6229618.1 PAS domain S-box protein [Candidatus Scalindua sp.]MBT6563331.1 PAS domain S-box protein [Candidatus Scalindua sp.]MBT7210604.1 PAS domain S-box protein [Candidatus Scalindua sp.]